MQADLFRLLWEVDHSPGTPGWANLFYYANAEDWPVYLHAASLFAITLIVIYYFAHRHR